MTVHGKKRAAWGTAPHTDVSRTLFSLQCHLKPLSSNSWHIRVCCVLAVAARKGPGWNAGAVLVQLVLCLPEHATCIHVLFLACWAVVACLSFIPFTLAHSMKFCSGTTRLERWWSPSATGALPIRTSPLQLPRCRRCPASSTSARCETSRQAQGSWAPS